MIGRSMEVCITTSEFVLHEADLLADVGLATSKHSHGRFFIQCAANSGSLRANSFVHVAQRGQLHCEHCARN